MILNKTITGPDLTFKIIILFIVLKDITELQSWNELKMGEMREDTGLGQIPLINMEDTSYWIYSEGSIDRFYILFSSGKKRQYSQWWF